MDSGAARALKTRSASSWSIPLWALLGSVTLHGLLLWPMGWHLPSWLRGPPERLVIRVLAPPARPARLSLVDPTQLDQTAPLPPEKPVVSEMAAATPKPQSASAPVDDPDEGFLPSEFLSNTAMPTQDIDLQDLTAPEAAGRLQLLLWINKAGEVVKVDVEVTEAPDWFTDQVISRFQQTRFEPGRRAGQPVASLMRIEVTF